VVERYVSREFGHSRLPCTDELAVHPGMQSYSPFLEIISSNLEKDAITGTEYRLSFAFQRSLSKRLKVNQDLAICVVRHYVQTENFSGCLNNVEQQTFV